MEEQERGVSHVFEPLLLEPKSSEEATRCKSVRCARSHSGIRKTWRKRFTYAENLAVAELIE
jgi:hypothetical protein